MDDRINDTDTELDFSKKLYTSFVVRHFITKLISKSSMSKNISTHSRFGRYVIINQDIALSILLRHIYMRYDQLQQSFQYLCTKNR